MFYRLLKEKNRYFCSILLVEENRNEQNPVGVSGVNIVCFV